MAIREVCLFCFETARTAKIRTNIISSTVDRSCIYGTVVLAVMCRYWTNSATTAAVKMLLVFLSLIEHGRNLTAHYVVATQAEVVHVAVFSSTAGEAGQSDGSFRA